MDPAQATQGRGPAVSDRAGPLLFARYAYAPNEHGYCGPADHRSLLEYGANGVVDPGLAEIARGFHGAWPYLELIAGVTGIGDPLDRRVVDAYWVGNRLLERVDLSTFGAALEQRFRRRAGPGWSRLVETVPAAGVPHHSFHVFCVYPWVGLLSGDGPGGQPLRVLDRCRIRWGQVVSADAGQAVVRCRTLTWDGRAIGLGPPRAETVRYASDGLGFVDRPEPGSWVSLHWDWMCEPLDLPRLRRLRAYNARTLQTVNERLGGGGLPLV